MKPIYFLVILLSYGFDSATENISYSRTLEDSKNRISICSVPLAYETFCSIQRDSIPYPEAKKRIRERRSKLRRDFESGVITMDSVQQVFTDNLVNTLIPYWYGTKWSFEGHTEIPTVGEVACGYFVSTTLRDMGLKLNRYKLAQKSPIDEAKVISCGTDIMVVEDIDPKRATVKIDAAIKEGIYFLGYDSGHVGYLLKKNGELLLIHSNYMSPFSVSIEKLSDSRVFQSFAKFYLVDITYNAPMMKKWLNNDTLE